MDHDSEQSREHALSILGQESIDPWSMPEPGPTTLMVAVVGDDPPTREWIRDVLPLFTDEVSILELNESIQGPEFALWAMPLSLGEHPVPVIAWAERVEEPESLPEVAAGARWMIGVQTVLDPQCPLQIWTQLARLLIGCSSRGISLFDQETEQWFDREDIDLYFRGSGATTHEGMLFRVHATAMCEKPEEADSIWLHTEGLRRCGCPEIEILELPARHLGVAHEMLDALGALFITRGVPAPGVRFEAGVGVQLVLNDWRASVEFLAEQSLGSTEHRIMLGGESDNPLLEAHAVVCGPDPVGTFRKIHTWPQAAIQAIESGRAALERTSAWTNSRSALARSLWPKFLELHADGRRMLACMALEAVEGSRNHVWIEVSEATPSSLKGVIVSDFAGAGLPPGASVVFEDLDALVDWYSSDEQTAARGDE